jgi:hypothetical protein
VTRRSPERGAGLLSTVAGVTVVLAFLTVAVQILLDLYTTSVVTAAAYDGVRSVATGESEPEAAEARTRELLGGLGDAATFEWTVDDPDVVVLHVVVPTQHFLLPVVSGVLGLDDVDRTIAVRVEQLQ